MLSSIVTFQRSVSPLEATVPLGSPLCQPAGGSGLYGWVRTAPQAMEPPSDRPAWGWVPGTNHKWGWGSLCSPKAQGLEGEGSGRPSSPFVPVSGALQASENAALRIKAPCLQFCTLILLRVTSGKPEPVAGGPL